MCAWSVQPPENRMSKCLPTGSTPSRVRPRMRWRASGWASVRIRPVRCSRRVAADRQIVSPSGTPRPHHHAPRAYAEPCLSQDGGEPRLPGGGAIHLLDLDLASAGDGRDQGLEVARVNVSSRQERTPTPLQVETELAGVEDHERPCGPLHPAVTVRPG